jgi:hypothetical protein
MVLNDEPFFGQDRIDQLIWRLEEGGVKKRANKSSRGDRSK